MAVLDHQTILFIGDSITYNGGFVNFVEAFIRVQSPSKQFTIVNAGLPSETVSGLSEPEHANGEFPRPVLFERIFRLLKTVNPTHVFVHYGINDGIYLPFDEQRFRNFKNGMLKLDQVLKDYQLPVVYITPPVFDSVRSPLENDPYDEVVHQYADWILAQQKEQDWQVVDAHWPMQEHLNNKRLEQPNYYLAKDGIHPNATGHFIIAKEILQYMTWQAATKDLLKQAHFLAEEWFTNNKKARRILQLVQHKHSFMKDAWLSAIGHKRPQMKPGLDLEQALKKAHGIDQKIRGLLKL